MPDHAPGVAVSVCPACADPAIVGSEVLLGATGAACTTAVCIELAELVPAEFEAVTTTRTVAPTSAAVNVYVCAAAGTMSTQLAPDESHLRH